MAHFNEFYDARDKITEILEKDFIGPVTEDECLSELPLQYYLMGKLYPQETTEEELDVSEDLCLESAMETYDASVSLSNQTNPSSVGLTCTLKSGVKEIHILVEYAVYVQRSLEELLKEGVAFSKLHVRKDRKESLWQREAFSFSKDIVFDNDKKEKVYSLGNGLQLHVYTHFIFDAGERVITAVLVNCNKSSRDKNEKNSKAIFQPVITITGKGDTSIFAAVDKKVHMNTDPELLEMELLYHDLICYAQGHGCSVVWDNKKNEGPRWIKTTFFPLVEVPQMKAAEFKNLKVFNMLRLANEQPGIIFSELKQFLGYYRDWISTITQKATIFTGDNKKSALININKCTAAYEQILRAICLLEDSAKGDKIAYTAFKMANEAMYMQRVQTLKRNHKKIDNNEINWYPFQLAFILHEIISFISPHGQERKKVDLLWFPTGGGKTEAYLGISAFVIFLRRLKNTRNDGVTVLMRYTLRLLTMQQLERASILIFACEQLRVKYNLGGEEFTIGLWVGDKMTPNRLDDADKALKKILQGHSTSKNPCVMKICPWCGQELNPLNYKVDKDSQRMIITCPNEDCDFHVRTFGLPIHLIDDAIYAHLPTFIISTIDKFAQIPLNDEPAKLFGLTSNKLPPELIIQDELHLISGPLGTVTGLYEAAITKFCEHDGTTAKVIASTATIRNAGSQILALYGKDYTQFPPQGITIKDSFFAKEATHAERPARLYCGVMGTGTTATTTLIKVNASLLFATRYLEQFGFNDAVINNYWTIVGYFNSLRELGGAYTQIVDSVQSRFEYLAKTKFVNIYQGVDSKIAYERIAELTSRLDSSKISQIIQKDLMINYHKVNHRGVIDFVLASNMISVGIDVGRLGNMVVAGQPKTNAEYIQATSRVGRNNPGLVTTVLNGSRSRDRSHYEQFFMYHSALYRFVEATSLTPFADRARDRGLQALFVGLCRYLVKGLLKNEDAVNFKQNDPEVKRIKQYIINYVKIIDKNEVAAITEELEDIANIWEEEASYSLVYNKGQNANKLLKPDTVDDRFSVMNSMRNVDSQASIYMCRR